MMERISYDIQKLYIAIKYTYIHIMNLIPYSAEECGFVYSSRSIGPQKEGVRRKGINSITIGSKM